MEITLDNFEEIFDKKILKRGEDYFENGHVTEVAERGNGSYEFIVEGSNTYTVHLELQEEVLKHFDCDCLYEGQICKHVVAALFYIKDDILGLIENTPKPAVKKKKEKSPAEQEKQLLKILSHEELLAFIHEACVNDKRFRAHFISKYIHLLQPFSKELYTRKLQSLIKSYSDRHGFIGSQDTRRLCRMVYKMVEEAETGIENGDMQKALFIALAIIEEMSEVLDYADNDTGEVLGTIEDGLRLLGSLDNLDLNEKEHAELFSCVLDLGKSSALKRTGFYYSVIALATDLVENKQEKDRILALLEELNKASALDDSDVQHMKLELIKKTEGEKAAKLFMEENSSNITFKRALIEEALKTKDYKKAELLAIDGVKTQKNSPFRFNHEFQNYLLTIYLQTGREQEAIALARSFLIESYEPRRMYDLLKSRIPHPQWQDYLRAIIDEIKDTNRWLYYGPVAKLYIWEEQWEALLKLLKQNASLERVESMEYYLANSYSDELVALYKSLILNYLTNNASRSHYKKACRYIQRITNLGAHQTAAALILQLKGLYPTRKALIEELNKL